MNHQIELVDLIVLVAVVLAVVGALRRRAGLLGALGAGLSSLVVAWLLCVAAVAWAPQPVARAVSHSRLVHAVPVPQHAMSQAGELVRSLIPR